MTCRNQSLYLLENVLILHSNSNTYSYIEFNNILAFMSRLIIIYNIAITK